MCSVVLGPVVRGNVLRQVLPLTETERGEVDLLRATCDLIHRYAPLPQSAVEDARAADRVFSPCFKQQPMPDADVEIYLTRQIRFDSDLWIVDVEDRAGRHMLDYVVP